MDRRTKQNIEDIADYYRKTNPSQRINLIISITYNFLILLFILGTIVMVFRSGNVFALFGNKQDLTRRFDCVSGDINETLYTYQNAQAFTQLYNGTCQLYHTENGDSKAVKEVCVTDTKKVQKIYFANEGFLKIDFIDCADCEHYWICYPKNETWYFEQEFNQPSNFKEGDYVRLVKCLKNETYFVKHINKIK